MNDGILVHQRRPTAQSDGNGIRANGRHITRQADLDNDGDLDILVVNQKPVLDYPVESLTKLYRNDSTKGNWIKIALKGVESESHGIGSRVEVVVGKTKMIREIDGGSSHISQNSTIAHFGLGDATKIDSIIVTWVGKGQQVLINQDVNNLITITEIPSKKGLPLWMVFGIVAASVLFVVIFYRFIKRNQ